MTTATTCPPTPPHSRSWPLERVLFAMAGTMTLLSALLAAVVSPWFLLLTAFVGVNQWLYVAFGACGASLILRRAFGLRSVLYPLGGRAMTQFGPIGRLGRYTATHFRTVAIAWALVAVVLGVFAPRVEKALSGAGWEATGSQSVAARKVIDKNFQGLSSSALMVVVHSNTKTVCGPRVQGGDRARVLDAEGGLAREVGRRRRRPACRSRVTATRRSSRRAPPRTPTRWSAPPTTSRRASHKLQGDGVQVSLTGASGMWSDFNTANRTAMMKSELISWPVTLVILLLAFGSLVAAGLPLMLTILGLMASAGTLYLGTQVLDISIWAMNFALMFALALGIDYALFIVYRFRGALFGSHEPVEDAVAETMDTAGKAVLFSGVTVLISLMAVMLVPSPAFRSMALGIMISVLFILAATLTLLPAVLGKLGPTRRQARAAVGPPGRAPLPEVRRLGRAPLAPPVRVRRARAGRPRSR